MNKESYVRVRGFTLIEMITVVAIIGILSTVVIANLGQAKPRARDSERITEVGQITLALEMYYNACRQYPAALLTTANNGVSGTCPNSLTLGSFLSTIPTPPEGGSYEYYTNAGKTAYIVKALLETNDAALASDVDGIVLTATCDDAPSGSPSRYSYCRKN